MAEGRDRDEWAHTASTLASIYNAATRLCLAQGVEFKDVPWKTPADFYPFDRKEEEDDGFDPFNTPDDQGTSEFVLKNRMGLPITQG